MGLKLGRPKAENNHSESRQDQIDSGGKKKEPEKKKKKQKKARKKNKKNLATCDTDDVDIWWRRADGMSPSQKLEMRKLAQQDGSGRNGIAFCLKERNE